MHFSSCNWILNVLSNALCYIISLENESGLQKHFIFGQSKVISWQGLWMPQFWCRSCLVLVQSQGLVDLLVMSETHPVCLNRAVHWSPGCCQTFLDLVDKYLLQTFCLLFDHSPPLLRYFALLDQALRKSLQETRDALVCTITVDIVFPSLPFVSWEYCDRQKS